MKQEKFFSLNKFEGISLWLRSLCCLASGLIMTLALPPANLWPFMLAGLAGFYIFFSGAKNVLQAGVCGWAFGFGYFAAGLWWIANALLVEGNPFTWVWPFAIAGFPALLAFFPTLTCVIHKRFFKARYLSGALYFIILLSVAEWLRGHIFTGFPWNLYGYGWSGWLAASQLAAIGGSYFLSLVTIILGVLSGFLIISSLARRNKLWIGVACLAIFASNLVFGYWRLQTPLFSYSDKAVRIVQPNISQEDKWNPKNTLQNLETLASLSRPDSAEQVETTYIIWPETALSERLLAYHEVRDIIRTAFSGYHNNVFLLTGWLRHEAVSDQEHFYNGLAVFDRDLTILALYDKSHLVPFGEYIPLDDILPLSPFVQMDGFTAGGGVTDITLENQPPFSPLICYEIIFPGAVKPNKGRTEWLVNVTNDAWYGNSPGPYQHFAQTRFRSIEEGIPVVRSANTGISGLIDSLGRASWQAELSTMAAKTLPLPKPLASPPLYSRIGDTLYFISLLFLAITAGILGAWQNRK